MLFAPEFPARPPRHRLRRSLVGMTALAVTSGGAVVGLATAAGASETVWDRVARCESGGNWSIRTGNGYYGGLQFSYTTWKAFGGQAYATTADRASKSQQITIAKKVLKVQGPGAWPVCSRRAGLTVANGLAVQTSRSTTRPAVNTGTPLVVDGVRGPATNRATERWVGGSVNGAWSRSDVQRLQRKVGTRADGQIGPLTTKALQRRVGASADGRWGSRTTAALQGYLNRVLG
ncbi:MAG TPA: transglycosylase family protein [Dermatophilaceae bacterium]|nr:transglycosylase family protein [Dermatophilaceae bacterium]